MNTGLDLHIKAMGLPEPVREHRFHDSRRWRFDFCWPDRMLAIEIEGGHWNLGRHQRAKGFQQDIEKYNEAVLLGWRLLRCTTDDVRSGRAIEWVMRAFGDIPVQKTAERRSESL